MDKKILIFAVVLIIIIISVAYLLISYYPGAFFAPILKTRCVPSEEICNGVDDDCDGQTDEGDLCPQNSECLYGTCRLKETFYQERLKKVYPYIYDDPNLKLTQVKNDIKEKSGTWQADLNPIFLKSDEEKKMLCGLKGEPPKTQEKPVTVGKNGELPAFFDWRYAHGNDYITSIKDQGNCGSCWAFGAVAALEGHTNAYYNNPNLDLDLSEQDLVSCFHGSGCGGAYDYQIEQIFSDYYQNTGIATEVCFPYTATNNDCSNKCLNWQEDAWKTLGYQSVSLTGEDIKQAVINYGPVEVGMTVYSDFFAYSGGIYSHTTESIVGYHAVTIVGFGVYDGMNYWIVKNSWGPSWGEDGYFRILAGDSGIDSWFAFVVIEPNPPQPQQVICEDSDGDEYCNWGIGLKPDNCPECDAIIEDCDDSNSSIFEGCGTATEPIGTLSVTSDPTGARVYVADQVTGGYIYRGETPLLTDLNTGTREVKITKEDYLDYLTSVDIIEGQTTELSVTLLLAPKLSYPLDNDILRAGDVIEINGTAPGPDFINYTIGWGIGENPIEWFTEGIILVNNGMSEIIEGNLATWDTSFITEADFYTIKLTVNYVGDQRYAFIKNVYLDPSIKMGWPQFVGSSFVFVSTAAAGNIYGDDNKEVIVGSKDKKVYAFYYDGTPVEGWPKQTGDWVLSSPALYDINDDGKLEIFIVSSKHWPDIPVPQVATLFAWYGNGTPVEGWPVRLGNNFTWGISTPTIDDIDNDGEIEIIARSGRANQVFVLELNGSVVAGWPQQLPGGWYSVFPAATADFDGDDDKEIVVADGDSGIYVFHHDGTVATGWPQFEGDPVWGPWVSVPTLADINEDGLIEILVSIDDGSTGRTYAFHYNGSVVNGWPKETSIRGVAGQSIGDIDNDGILEIVANFYYLGTSEINVWNSGGTPVEGWPQQFNTYLYTPSTIGNIDLEKNNEIIISGSTDTKMRAFHYNGSQVENWPKLIFGQNGAVPTLSDIDNDEIVEIIIGTVANGGYLIVYESPIQNEGYEWPTLGHNFQRTCLYTCPLLGDVNKDGKIDCTDAQWILEMVVGLRPINLCGDVNGDGNITAYDASLLMQQYSLTCTCSDGTPHGQCSSTKPRFCDNGILINNCQECGCPPEKSYCCSDGSCARSSSMCPLPVFK